MRYPNNHGFTLLEVLITVLVLSIGILGVAGLQFLSLQSAVDSSHKAYAMHLAEDLFERMRANPLAASNYINADYGSTAFAVTAATDCESAACTKDDLANFDMVAWHRMLRNKNAETPVATEADADSGNRLLPSATAVVSRLVDNPVPLSDVYQVVITWDRVGNNTISSTESYTLITEL